MSKFDQFIEDFDKKLNKDTSTISTLSSPTESAFDANNLTVNTNNNKPPLTPTLESSSTLSPKQNGSTTQSTPTKPRKNSVSSTSHPLSPNPSSARKKGLNLNIAMSKGSTPKSVSRKKSSDQDMNEVLRKMASSEIRIIELKDELKLIQQRIHREEEELMKLRKKVAKNLNQPKNNLDKESKSPDKHSPLKSMTNRDSGESVSTPSTTATSESSYWSKPMHLLNQFDQMLQNEFEKLGKDQSEKDDVLKGVSNSLWGFVSEVKQGLMGEEEQKTKTTPVDEKEEELVDFRDVAKDKHNDV